MKIGIDLDNVLVSLPIFIPYSLIDMLYKRKNKHLAYRLPGRAEQKIRVLSHTPLLRHSIKNNIASLQTLSEKLPCDFYLISSRFSFLKRRTDDWTKKNKIDKYFKGMYFNYDNLQPHIFKNRIINRLKIQEFIDDDLDLILFLSKENPRVNFYWISKSKLNTSLPKNVTQIKNLKEFEKIKI